MESLEIPLDDVVPLLDVCKAVLEDPIALTVNAAKDPAHPQVTAIRKLNAIAVDRQPRPVLLDSEEVCCLSKLFSSLKVFLEEHLSLPKSSISGWQSHTTSSLSTLQSKVPRTTDAKPPPPPLTISEAISMDKCDVVSDDQAMFASRKEVVDRMSFICETKVSRGFLEIFGQL